MTRIKLSRRTAEEYVPTNMPESVVEEHGGVHVTLEVTSADCLTTRPSSGRCRGFVCFTHVYTYVHGVVFADEKEAATCQRSYDGCVGFDIT